MSLELIFALVALTPLALGTGLLGIGDGGEEEEDFSGDMEPESDTFQDVGMLDINLEGTDEADSLEGTDDQEIANLLADDDFIDALGGDDSILGGLGDDTIEGGAGDDLLYGEEGDDEIFGALGDDTIAGGSGADLLSGGAGNDVLGDGAGRDSDEEADTLEGGEGDDLLYMGDGDSGTGGDGVDTFAVDGSAAITDFDAEEDQLVIRYDMEPAPEVESQQVTSQGVVLNLSDGTTITLDGLTEEVPLDRIAFMGPEGAEAL
ncbi:calcium-binding protein [Roseivivax sp.]